MSYAIHQAKVRNGLRPRREPYWGAPIEKGRYLGFRKIDDSTGTWIARLRDDDNNQRYRSLGQATSGFDCSQAKRQAETWFKDADAGVSDQAPTVKKACQEYVDNLRAEGRDETAQYAEKRFIHTVYGHSIARIPLDKVRAAQIRAWRNELGGGNSSKNRTMTWLKAALNFAVAEDRVNVAAANQWRKVKPHKDADGRREIYLDLAQRRALLKACSGAARDMVEAAALTGARPGELASATRSQFDARTGEMAFNGKTGKRKVPLSPPAVALFKRLAKSKLPSAHLFTADDGKPWANCKWSLPVREAAAKAKLPKGTVLYTLRHSWITETLLAGMATLEVSKLSGTSLPMIEKNYGKLVTEVARERLAQITLL